MRTRLRSAAYRIAFANFLAFAIGIALLGTVVFVAMHFAFKRQLDSEIADEIQVLVDEYRNEPEEFSQAIALREASPASRRMLFAVFAPDGRRIAGSLQARRPDLGLHDVTFTDPKEGPDWARGMAVDLSPRARLLVAADREWLEQIDETVIAVFILAFGAACLVALGGAILFGSYLKRRLDAISNAAEMIIAGDFRERMPTSGSADEFDQLATTLNRMLDRIQELLENLRQVSSDIAHDLRTPLSRLRTQLERSKLADAEPSEIVERAIEQLDQVLSLFSAILRIAEVEAGETRRYFKPLNVSLLTTELAESFGPAVQDEGRTFLSSVEPDLFVQGDSELLAQAAINLIENAQNHTPIGTIVQLMLVRAKDRVCLRVIDDGPGVATADLPRIVKRFTRLQASRNTPGYGLGLNLVSAVARLHGGRLVLRNNAPGLSATIELPVFVQNVTKLRGKANG